MRIVVIGAGVVAGYFGGRLAQAYGNLGPRTTALFLSSTAALMFT